MRYELAQRGRDAWDSGGQFEYFVDELILTPHVSSAHPSNLSLPQHVDREFSVTVRTEPVTLFQSEMMGLETPGTGMRR
jgi:hypothetical protein